MSGVIRRLARRLHPATASTVRARQRRRAAEGCQCWPAEPRDPVGVSRFFRRSSTLLVFNSQETADNLKSRALILASVRQGHR
jgi:hypothetical protein